jgi:hypothetical protein
MMKNSKKIWIVLLSVCFVVGIFQTNLLAAGVENQVKAVKNSSSTQVIKPKVNQKISITSKSYAEIINANILPGSKATLSYTLSIYNGDNKEIKFDDYWVKVITKSGQTYPIKLVSSDAKKNSISPLTSQQFTFYSIVNNTTKLQDVVVEFIKWDFDLPNTDYQRKLGQFLLVESTAVLGTTKLEISGLNIFAKIDNSVINTSSDYLNAKVKFKFYNAGVESVIVPKLNYFIKTSGGILYTLTVGEDKEITIQPKDDYFLKLSGKIPIGIANEDWQLIICKIEELDKDKINIPVATYMMVEGEVTPASTNIQFSTNDGEYDAKVVSLQRLPYNEKDILSATVELTNTGTETLPVPIFTGSFVLDGFKVESTAGSQIEQLSSTSRIAPNTSKEFVVFTEIPYTMEYTDLEIVLQAKDGEDQVDLGTVSAKGIYATLPKVQASQSYSVNDVGNQTGLQVKSTKTYELNNSNLVYVEMIVNNNEKRAREILKLGGYFATANSVYYPATVTEIKDVMNPNSKALIAFWSKIPKDNKIEDLQLMVGRSVVYGKETKSPIIDAVSFALPKEAIASNAIEVFPYTFNIDKVLTILNGSVVNHTASGLKVEITYKNFIESDEFERKLEGHELLVEFVDSYTGTTYTEKAVLTKVSGENGVLTVNISAPDILTKMSAFGIHNINLYDQFEGGKKLISTVQGFVAVIEGE